MRSHGRQPEYRLLHRRDRAGGNGTQDRRVRLSRHRRRDCAASTGRQHETTFNNARVARLSTRRQPARSRGAQVIDVPRGRIAPAFSHRSRAQARARHRAGAAQAHAPQRPPQIKFRFVKKTISARVLKTVDGANSSEGSNPSPAAVFVSTTRLCASAPSDVSVHRSPPIAQVLANGTATIRTTAEASQQAATVDPCHAELAARVAISGVFSPLAGEVAVAALSDPGT